MTKNTNQERSARLEPKDTQSGLTQQRLNALKQLLREGLASTQDELCKALKKQKYQVTQSTVSRDLRRVGAIKTTDSDGEIMYCLPEISKSLPLDVSDALGPMLLDIQHNESMVVLHTTPGSANLVARHLDSLKDYLEILGSIAGDDTIFVAPGKIKNISEIIGKIREEF